MDMNIMIFFESRIELEGSVYDHLKNEYFLQLIRKKNGNHFLNIRKKRPQFID